MDERELRYWIRLSRLELSARAAIALIEHFGGPEAVFEASESELALVEQLTEKGGLKVLGQCRRLSNATSKSSIRWALS